MSVTATIVWVCDNCGAREELHEFHKPEGWDARTPWSDGMDFAFIGAGHMPLSFGKAKFRELCAACKGAANSASDAALKARSRVSLDDHPPKR